MNHKEMRLTYEKKMRDEYDYTQKRAQQERFSENQEDFVWATELQKVISPYQAGRDTSGFSPDRKEL